MGVGGGVDVITTPELITYGGYHIVGSYNYRKEGFCTNGRLSLKGGQRAGLNTDYLYNLAGSITFGGALNESLWLAAGPAYFNGVDVNDVIGLQFQTWVPVKVDRYNNIELHSSVAPTFNGTIVIEVSLMVTHNLKY